MNKTDLYSIPETIKAARCRAKMSSEELAEKAGISKYTAYQIESRCKPVRWKTARRVTEALNLTEIYTCFGMKKEGV